MVVFEIVYEKFIRSRFMKQPRDQMQEIHIDFNGELFSRIHF